MIRKLDVSEKTPFSQMLKQIRTELGLTTAEVAKRSGYTEPSISRWETGERVPKIEVAVKVLESMGCEVAVIKPSK